MGDGVGLDGQISTSQATSKSVTDGLLANLQERLVETESGFSIVTTNTGNTDLRTLADLATMGEKASSNHVAGRISDHTLGLLTGNGTGEDDSSRNNMNTDNVHAQEHIAKAFDRYANSQIVLNTY